MKPCPYCFTLIDSRAVICPQCRHRVNPWDLPRRIVLVGLGGCLVLFGGCALLSQLFH